MLNLGLTALILFLVVSCAQTPKVMTKCHEVKDVPDMYVCTDLQGN